LAAVDPIGLSADGVSFTATYPGTLFGGSEIVPGGSITRSFWVKNQEASSGNLAVAIRDVASADGLFLGALTVDAQSGSASSATVVAAEIDPCVSLLKGVPIAASGVARVDVTLSLADTLVSLQSQGSIADFDVAVTLTSTDVAAPDGCTVPAPSPSPSPGAGGTANPPGFAAGATVPGAGGDSTPTPTPRPTAPPLPDSSDDGDGAGLFWNTDRFYQEYFVAGWLVAFLLGGLYAWHRHRRRERMPE